MNPLTDFLNVWGDRFVSFALPMLIQSSLLIAVLFLIDLAIRRHVRAVTLYALWLLLLIKLVLPPGLAMPTGIGYWLRTQPTPEAQTHLAPATIRISDVPVTLPRSTVQETAPTAPALSRSSRLLILWLSGGVALLGFVLFRSRNIRRQIDDAVQPPKSAIALLEECSRQLGLRRPVELRLAVRSMSPSVCGWWRPVVLIPRHLIENLSESQLRAVLLHELSHVRRGDLRVNSLQTLLQIFYWWNPLLWLANAHIRRVREQTVDELVMVTLDADAGTYPATLLEVAKVSFTRPALSLGLIGIVESKSALKRRITRLLDREVPRSAKLGFGSTLTILLAALLLLPMAQGQLKRAPSVAAAPQADADRTTVVNVMVQFVELPDAAIAQLELGEPSVRTGNGHFAWRLSADQLGKIGRQFKDRTDVTILASPRVTARSGTQTRIEVSEPSPGDSFTLATNKGSITPACDLTPQVNRAQIDLDIVARITESGTVAADPNGQLGLLPLRIKDAELEKASDGAVYSVNAIGYIKYDVGTARVTVGDGEGIVLQNPELKNTRGNRYVVLVSPKMDRSQESAGAPTDGPLNSAGAAGSQLAQALATRTYRVNPAVFLERLRAVSGTFPGTNTQELVRTFFESAGVGSQPPNAIFFSDQTGMLMIRAPVEESDLALQLINQLQPAPAQVTIETRFLELPSDAAAKLGLDLPLVTARSNNWTRVLTAEQMSKALTAAEQLNGVDVLTAPKVTTLSGRQTQIQITEIQTIVSGIKPEAFSGEGIRSSNGVEAQPMITSQVPVGPILNLIPRVGDDGYTIRLFAVPTCEEFLGYDTNEADEVQIRVDGKEEKVVMPMPRFRKRLMHASAAVYDGQTLVLGCPTRTLITKRRDGTSERTSIAEEPDKRLLVFVTATIIDPAGNRVHAPGNLPFPENEVPRSKPLDRQ